MPKTNVKKIPKTNTFAEHWLEIAQNSGKMIQICMQTLKFNFPYYYSEIVSIHSKISLARVNGQSPEDDQERSLFRNIEYNTYEENVKPKEQRFPKHQNSCRLIFCTCIIDKCP